MQVRAILERKGTRIVTVRLNETIATAVRLLKRDDIGALVVKDVVRTEGNTVVGILSERDIVRALDEHGVAALNRKVGDLMTGQVIFCTEDDDLDRVVELMRDHRIRHLPVLDDGRMVGVVSTTDVLRFYHESRGMAPTGGAAPEERTSAAAASAG